MSRAGGSCSGITSNSSNTLEYLPVKSLYEAITIPFLKVNRGAAPIDSIELADSIDSIESYMPLFVKIFLSNESSISTLPMKQGNRKINKPRVGVHTSIAGGISKSVERAAELNCSTMQIFSHSPRQWRQTAISAEESDRFRVLRNQYDINPVFIHTSYLINLASLSDTVLPKSIDLLSYEMRTADEIGAEYVVLHTGSASGEDGKGARKRAASALMKAVPAGKYRASLLLENTAGSRGDITSSIRSLADIIDKCNSDSVAGICIDTCHAFAAGYDLTTDEGIEIIFHEIKKYVGIDKLKLLHLNDSKKPLGSGVDRHEHIGEGFIGDKGFKKLLSDRRISRVPLILETPKKSDDDDKENLRKVFKMLGI